MAAAVALICSAATARGAARQEGWLPIGAYAVALAMVFVAYELASRAYIYWGY